MTTKTTIMLSVALAAIFAVGVTGLTNVQAEQTVDPSSLTESQIEAIATFTFNEQQQRDFESIAKNHPEVKDALGDKDINFVGVGVAGNLKNPESRLAIAHFLTDDNTVSVVIDEQSKEILDVKSDVIRLLTNNNAFAIAKYDGSETIRGVEMRLDMPTYTHETGATYTAIVLNGAKSGSTTANLCAWQNAPDDYWMQSGLLFDTDGIDVVWADTITNCAAINVNTLDYSTGDTLRYRNYITDLSGTANDQVTAYIYNEENADYFSYSRTVADTSNFMTGDVHTSVFFENANTSDTTQWENGFANEELTVLTAKHRTTTGSSYVTWDGETKAKANCGGITGVAALMDDQFDSTLYSVTWDLLEMRSQCDK